MFEEIHASAILSSRLKRYPIANKQIDITLFL